MVNGWDDILQNLPDFLFDLLDVILLGLHQLIKYLLVVFFLYLYFFRFLQNVLEQFQPSFLGQVLIILVELDFLSCNTTDLVEGKVLQKKAQVLMLSMWNHFTE